MPQDLRTYLDGLARESPDEIYQVNTEVDPNLELTGVVAKLEEQNRYPAIFFRRVKGTEQPVLINVHASYPRLASALGTTVDAMVEEYARREGQPRPLRWVDSGPVQEIVQRGDEADVTRLPMLVHNGGDTGAFLAGALTICADPDTGRLNAGIYKAQVLGPRELLTYPDRSHHGYFALRKWHERGEPMPAVMVIGHHPGLMMASVSKLAGIGGELEVAGGLMDEDLPVVRAQTVDLPVPAYAEIVIEGHIRMDRTQMGGHFGEWPGYYTPEVQRPFFEVSAITMRRDPIYQDISSAHAEHRMLGALPRMGSILRRVREFVPDVRAVNLPLSGCGRAHCYISMTKHTDGEPKQAAFVAFATEFDIRMVIVVDDDVNVFNETEVLWAVATRFDAREDLTVMENCMGIKHIPVAYDVTHSQHGGMTTKMILDATRPAPPADFPKRAQVPEEVLQDIQLDRYLEPFRIESLAPTPVGV